ncbi:GT99 family glycosyltransferase N-terminal domain-containing protein [Massilia suwonensis]|uniref:Glycosyltransferase 99 N-terminal domain-containing protein n=1 Tax=Massilia suwonensis TaxID=648895 RepID=A0ABW0MPG2_9BURK
MDRGAGPLFHLIMLLQMSRFAPGEICFLGDDAYFDEEHIPFGEELALGTIRFTCVSRERYRAYAKASLPFAAVAALYDDERNHLDAFKDLLTAEHAPLVDAIAAALDELTVASDAIEAFLTWSNCPSLSAFAARLGKPVIHNELGPFRGHAYQDTVYFDFQGVNGNTTPAVAWTDHAALAAELDGVEVLAHADLCKLLFCGTGLPAHEETGPKQQRYPLGVALQVEDDSNTLVYGRGYDAIRLLYQAQRNFAPEQVLVRSHPGARLGYRGGLGERDASATSVAFLQRIDHLVTINSSVAAEAALWGVPFTALGDTPFSVLSSPLPPSQAAAAGADPALLLNALLLAYLVPGTFLFDPDYYRWRLAGATVRDCFTRHLGVFRRNAVQADAPMPELPAPAPAMATPVRNPAIPHRNPALWSATRSLSRKVDGEQKHLAELEAQLAAAVAERDKNWEERCWFQTNTERIEQEMESLRIERDTLRFALAKHAEIERLREEYVQAGTALNARHTELEARFVQAGQALAARHGELEARVGESQAYYRELTVRQGEIESALAEMRSRFEAFETHLGQAHARHATAEAQSSALLDELHRTQRERIEARGQDAGGAAGQTIR